ncbi:MAG: efflux RND transporter permease subunit [Acidobacteria bacterium]|nr:MAG: efflux RND transporter permease subunit [Acidobacteriota bacterium]
MFTGIGPAGRIGHFFIESKLTPLLVAAALAVGAFAVVLTPREEEPQIVVPMVDLFVGLPGASPAEVENRVTIPLEKRMWEIPGVEYVYSVSRPGMAMVTVRFYVGEDQERSLVKVYEKLVSGMDRMPAGATPPLVKVRTIDDVPVLGLTLWSSRHDGFELRQIAAELKKEIDRLDEVSVSRIIGGRRRAVLVRLDPERMSAFGVDPAGVASALQMQNAALTAGEFDRGDRRIRVETGALLRDRDEVARLVVGLHAGRPVYLADVAEIADGPEEPREYVAFGAGPAAAERGIVGAGGPDRLMPAVTIAIAKRKGSDASWVVDEVMKKVETLRGSLIPPDVQITVTRDYGATARTKADELLMHLLGAILSVTVVIALSLGWRGAAVVFVSVPVTFALTLFVYYLFGYTLNRVTLFALIFVTGIVVDDSIIVVENIVRHFQIRKLPPLQAAVAAVDEVGNPTILATLTVIAAVLPMAFVRGLMGPYMRPMPVGASLAMTFSLAVALVVAPYLGYRVLRGTHGADEKPYVLEETRIYRTYNAILRPLLVSTWRRWLFLGFVTLLLVLSMVLFPLKWITVKMLPFDNKSELQVIIDMPEGTTLERTARVAREMASYMMTVPEVTDVELYAGTASPHNFNGLVRHYDLRQGPNVADLQVNFVDKDARDDQSHDIARRIRPELTRIAEKYGAAVKIAEVPPGPPVLATLLAEVYGPTEEARLAAARRILDVFRSTDGVVDVDWFVEDPQPKLVFKVDREKAARAGVPAAAVARALRLALGGEPVGLLHDEDAAEPVPIELRLPRAQRSSAADLEKVRLASMNGTLVPLSELVRVEETVVPPSRYRKNLKPVIYVAGDVAGREESPVYAILKMADEIAEIETPGGAKIEQYYRDEPFSTERVAMKWDGEWHITYEVFRDLGGAFAVVLVLIYMLIIAWFKSFKVPLVMMIAIPLSLVGILPGHWLFGAFFTATSMIGFIALAGIMVRNSVLLIDFVDLAREQGKTLGEAVIEAGAVRFRPILLTAGTVVVGAFVIIFDPIFEGLAISLMAGSVASTMLTLVVVPLVYYMVEKRRQAKPYPDDWTACAAPADR